MQPVSGEYGTYRSALVARYSSREMLENFSEYKKAIAWRKLWLWIATAQRKLGVEQVKADQLAEMEATLANVDFERVGAEEARLKHDLMAHVHAWRVTCPTASAIIHLGATSEDIKDNADLILMRNAIDILLPKLARCCDRLCTFALKFKDLPCLGYTHLQAAQLVTMGKRACIWLFDLVRDLENLERVRNEMRLKGLKGATGTQASYLTLMKGDANKVYQLEKLVAEMAGFSCGVYPVCGQTCSRKVDSEVLAVLAGLGASLHKMFSDIRLLCSFHEIGEPLGSDQIGSSAMPYKQNPVRSERCCGIARHLITLSNDGYATHAVQWLERSLDDSSNRRLVIPEAFLTADAALETAHFVAEGFGVNEKIVAKRVSDQIHNLISEEIIVAVTSAGGDRQACHEQLRRLSFAASARVRDDPTLKNDLIDRIKEESFFAAIHDKIDELIDPKKLIGLAPSQVERFVAEVRPALQKYSDKLNVSADLAI